MKLLFDQNMPYKILQYLPDQFADSRHVKSEGLINAADRQIWEFAKENDFTIVTQDSDFDELNSLLGFPPKIIWIRTGNLNTNELINLLIDSYLDFQNFGDDNNYGCLEIVRKKELFYSILRPQK